MRPIHPLHKIYGGLQIIRVCRDWPEWFYEYLARPNDGSDGRYRMRCGVTLYTRRNRSDMQMIDEIWAYRKYDYFGYRIAPDSTVVDIGANIGTFSVYAATVCGASRVLSFEPHPENYRLLTKNVEQNQLRNVTCVNQAIAGSRGARLLRLHPRDSGCHSLVTRSHKATIEVDCCTLDDIFDRFALTRIHYLKVDCEGAEYEIFENGTSRLRQIDRISMETHTTSDRKSADLERLLRAHGFAVRLFRDSRLYATRSA